LARDKIKKVLAAQSNGDYVAPTFRIDEDLHGLTVALETGASSDDLKRMQVAVNACCNDLARLLRRNVQIWRCTVVVDNEEAKKLKYMLDASSSERWDGSSRTGARVLVVEDDAQTAASIQMMLSKENFICDTTDLGEDGLEIGKLYDYDIIILDLMLPDIDGYEVLRRLRAARVRTPS
jgi:hypothetical protein